MAGCSIALTPSFLPLPSSGTISIGLLTDRGDSSIRTAFEGTPLTRMKSISILGSTGSIGRQCLKVVESLPDRLKVVALAAGTNLDELVGQIVRHHPKLVSVADSAR